MQNLMGPKPHLSQLGRNTSTKKVGRDSDSPETALLKYTCNYNDVFFNFFF